MSVQRFHLKQLERTRICIFLAILAVYAVMGFFFGRQVSMTTAFAFSILAAVAAGHLLGTVGGIVGVLLIFTVNTLIIAFASGQEWPTLYEPVRMIGFLVLMFSGTAVGLLRDRHRRIFHLNREHQRADETRRMREKLYRDAIAAANSVAYQHDFSSNRYEYIDEGIQDLIGYDISDITTDIWRRIVAECVMHGEAAHFSSDELQRRYRAGMIDIWRADYECVTKAGEVRWLSDTAVPIRDENGHVTGSLGILQNITERKQSEERLKSAHDELERRVLERTAELAASNRQLNREIAEREHAQYVLQSIAEGTSADIGADFFSSLVSNLASTLKIRCTYVCESLDWPTTKSRVIAGCEAGRIVETFEYTVADTPCAQTVLGKVAFFPDHLQQIFIQDEILAELDAASYCGLPIFSPTGEVIGHIALIDDKPMAKGFSELPVLRIFAARTAAELHRRRAEDRVEQMQAEFAHLNRVDSMGQMAAALAHEIDQPLGAIANDAQACLRGMRNGLLNAQEIDEALKEIVSESMRAAEMIRRIRQFMSRREPQRSAADVNELVREVARLVDFDARRHKAQLGLDLTETLPTIVVDRIQIQQVLVNLVRNAFDAMDEIDEHLREAVIRTTADNDGIRVSVSDMGRRVSDDTVSKMFEPYFSTKTEGVGMGLNISRSIIEWHGGHIRATPNPDSGLTVEFTIPAGDDASFSIEQISLRVRPDDNGHE